MPVRWPGDPNFLRAQVTLSRTRWTGVLFKESKMADVAPSEFSKPFTQVLSSKFPSLDKDLSKYIIGKMCYVTCQLFHGVHYPHPLSW